MSISRPTACLLSLLVCAGCSRQAQAPRGETATAAVSGSIVTYPPDAPQLSYLSIAPAQPRTLAVSHMTGRLYLREDATVRIYSPVAGQVSALKADVGDSVRAGATLAEILSPDYFQALADARTADAAFAAADKALERTRDLLAHGAVATKDLEAAQASYAAAEAERDRATARLSLFHGDASAPNPVYALRTPIAGTVVERNLNAGQEVRADQMLANATNLLSPFFVVSDTSQLWLQVDAAESDLPELQVGQKVRVASSAFPGIVFSGTLTNIAPSLDPATRTVRVRAVVDNAAGTLKAEMYVTVDVLRDESRVAAAGVLLPSKSIFTVDRKPYLFVELSPGKFERRQVEIGTEKDGNVPVLSGVASGTRVVVDGGLLLQSVLEPDN